MRFCFDDRIEGLVIAIKRIRSLVYWGILGGSTSWNYEEIVGPSFRAASRPGKVLYVFFRKLHN